MGLCHTLLRPQMLHGNNFVLKAESSKKETKCQIIPSIMGNFKEAYKNQLRCLGRAMAQVVSHRSLTAEARVRSWFRPCGTHGGKVASGQVFH